MNILYRILQRCKREVRDRISAARAKSRPIDFVDLGKHKIMLYTSDHAYTWVREHEKHQSTLAHARNIHTHGFAYADVESPR